MIFKLDDAKVEEGTVLLFGIRYGASTSGKIYTFAGLKAGGRWYFTGTGPTDAGWTAVQRWLERDGRQVVWVKAVTGMDLLWDEKSEARANHPSRTGSPAASAANLRLVSPAPEEADELLEQVPEFPSTERPDGVYGFDDYGLDPYGN